jgi:hypothetical protein
MAAQASTQAQVFSQFAEPKETFSIDKLKQFVFTAKDINDLKRAKKYLCSYFILYSNPHRVFMWRPDIKSFEHISVKNISMLIYHITQRFYIPTSNPEVVDKKEFNIHRWFMFDNTLVSVATCDPVKLRLFKVKSQVYLNIFLGFLHQLQPLTAFENKVHLAVKFIFMHI